MVPRSPKKTLAVFLLSLVSAGAFALSDPPAGPGDTLSAIAVLSESDAWAAGQRGHGPTGEARIFHWNGTVWSPVAMPPASAKASILGAVAIAPGDVYFVGGHESDGRALILHWDGTTIGAVAHPNPGAFNRLYAAAAVGPGDVWAVGECATGGVSRPLVLHWNGAAWAEVKSPTPSGRNTQLYGVAATAADDVWAVGASGAETFTLHWDGARFKNVKSPASGLSSWFSSVSASATDDVWAVGRSGGDLFAARWDGGAWSPAVPASPPDSTLRELSGVLSFAPDDVWAVGFYTSGGKWCTLVEHWDGASWHVVESPSPHPSMNQLRAIAKSSGKVWAAGQAGGTLVTRWDGRAWTVLATGSEGAAAAR